MRTGQVHGDVLVTLVWAGSLSASSQEELPVSGATEH